MPGQVASRVRRSVPMTRSKKTFFSSRNPLRSLCPRNFSVSYRFLKMKIIFNLAFFFLHVATSCVAQKRHFGNYYNKWRYWGPMLILKADSSFEYIERANVGEVKVPTEVNGRRSFTTSNYFFYDSSYGTYSILNDTVSLHFATDIVKGDFNGFNIRPGRLYWRRRSLFYIHPLTNEVLRQKEYYMKWSKRRAPNLSRYDQTYEKGGL
jgi:hypothetical protein